MIKYNSPIMFVPLILAVWMALDAIHNMVSLWTGTDTYMHGAFVIPLAALMAYRKALPDFKPSPLSISQAGALAVLWGALMMLGVLSMINVIQQVAVLSMIPLLVLASGGWRTLWYYRSPLILIFFAVPVGDFLIPYLQSITADMSVWMLKATGVSVLRNGWYISIANADFRVAEACSGVNFLISTFTVSVFYALTYMDKVYKRIIFMSLGIVVPLVSNGLRVYMIIMIAEMGNVEAATGVDHLVYGWIFFVFILILLFIIGHFMQDPLVEDQRRYLRSIKEIKVPSSLKLIISIICLQIPVLGFIATMPSGEVIVSERIELPKTDLLGPRYPYADSIDTSVVNGANFYHINYASEGPRKKVISFENRFFNPDIWSVKNSEKVILNGVPMTKMSLIDLSGRRYTLYFTYKVGDTYVNNKISLKLQQALHKLIRKDFGGSVYMWMVKDGFDEKEIAFP